jgi:predicted MFS family arabinose efflux permease
LEASESPVSARVYIAVALIGLSGAWNAGTVGPVASEIAGEFEISLGVVGILAGTLFLGASVVGLMFAAQVGERIGLLRGLKLACGLGAAGNLLFAVTPVFAGMAISRVLVGLAFALINPLGETPAASS